MLDYKQKCFCSENGGDCHGGVRWQAPKSKINHLRSILRIWFRLVWKPKLSGMKTQRKDSSPVRSAKESKTKIVNYTTRIPGISGGNYRSVCSGRKVHEVGMLLLFQQGNQRTVVPRKKSTRGPHHAMECATFLTMVNRKNQSI